MKQKADKLLIYLKVWKRLTALQFQSQIANARAAALVFILGKLLRFLFAFATIWVVVGRAKVIAGFTLPQAVFILTLFQLISTLTQLFFRGVYIFKQRIQDGYFDFYLLNPLSELFYSLFSYTDPLDIIMLIPYGALAVWAWLNTGVSITVYSVLLLIITIGIAMLMVLAVHIAIVAIGVIYLEVDNTIMLYRDLEKMSSFPIDMYGKFGSVFLTYILPLTLIATTPAKLVFQLMSPQFLLIFMGIALFQLTCSLRLWQYALTKYSSASS